MWNYKVKFLQPAHNVGQFMQPAVLNRFPTPALDHNFSTGNLRKSSKVSKDSDCGLVSNKNFSEILPSNAWHPGVL